MYKDKEAQKKAVREAVKKHRKGITSEGITKKGITLLKRPNQMGKNGLPEMNENLYDSVEIWDGKPRYVGPFSDGQVLDRKAVPLPAFNPLVGGFTPNKGVIQEGVCQK